MHLLNAKTLELRSFKEHYTSLKYAILSHTWDDDEILFDDISHGGDKIPHHKAAFSKVVGSCKQALLEGLEYIWIDTCCVDKSSSAELSYAINSMFKWYQHSAICYVYLADVNSENLETFKESRWFKRGWTLQELIAPADLCFFDNKWTRLGGRDEFADKISKITSIPTSLLSTAGRNRTYASGDRISLDIQVLLSRFSCAARMSWASNRSTTRPEDMSYCLLGIFDANMPLLYGEGGVKAFKRLQDEILKCSCDQSLLAFEIDDEFVDQNNSIDYIAAHPKLFLDSGKICLGSDINRNLGMINTNQGMEIDLLLCPARVKFARTLEMDFEGWLGLLDCGFADDFTTRPAILLQSVDEKTQDAGIKQLCRWGFGLGRVCDKSDYAYFGRYTRGWLEEMAGKLNSTSSFSIMVSRAIYLSSSSIHLNPRLAIDRMLSKSQPVLILETAALRR
jgi:hypothetical protein